MFITFQLLIQVPLTTHHFTARHRALLSGVVVAMRGLFILGLSVCVPLADLQCAVVAFFSCE